MYRAKLTCAAALVAALGWLHQPSLLRALEPDVDALVGTYRFVGGQTEVRAVASAIDDAVDELNLLIRGIARRRLKEPNMPTDEVRISSENGTIIVSRTAQPAVSAPASGQKIRWLNPRNGNELEVSHRMTDDGALEQVLIGDRGTSTNVFLLATDGKLVIKSTIEADALRAPIRFSTTYARK